MELKLHANATTTPKTRSYIQSSDASVTELAEELGLSETTVRRWRNRNSVIDRSHTPKRLAVSLNETEERLVVELRTAVSLSLDDIVEVMHRCINPSLSRSAIHRCLKRHDVSVQPKIEHPAHGTFEEASIGFIHVDLKHLTKLDGIKTYVFVAIDRATRFVFIDIVEKRSGAVIARCLEKFIKVFPATVHTIVTDNGSEFTDRFGGARWRRREKCEATGRHPFDLVCTTNNIDHRLIKPHHPQTNGMVERFNRRLADALRSKSNVATNAGRNKFLTNDERNTFIENIVYNYNSTRLRCLHWKSPIQILANLTGHNTNAGIHVVHRLRGGCGESRGYPRSRA